MPRPRAESRTAPVSSLYSDDADFQELLLFFYKSLAEQRPVLCANFERQQWNDLASQAHQLKGAGGGYGFPGLTETAWALEVACHAGDVREISPRLNDLLAYIDRILSL